MIQAQYDAALKDPPWEINNTYDIDDRPRKKGKVTERWYYRLETADGRLIEEQSKVCTEPNEAENKRRASSQSAQSETEVGVLEADEHQSPDPSAQLEKEGLEAFARQVPVSVIEEHISTSDFPRASSTIPSSELRPLTPASSQEAPYSSPLSSPPALSSPPWSPSLDKDLCPPSSHHPSSRRQDAATPRSPAPSQSSNESPAFIQPQLAEPPTSSQSSVRSQVVVEIPVRSTSSTTSQIPPIHPRTKRLQRQGSGAMLARSDTAESSSSQSSRNSLPNMKGRDLFDSMIWQDPFTTSIFYMFISSLRRKVKDEVISTTYTHKFIRSLRDNGRLVRNYTQNIDCLEEREGLCTELKRGVGNKSRFKPKIKRESLNNQDTAHDNGVECVLLHGSLSDLRCGVCAKLSSWDGDREEVTLAGSAPDCPNCEDYSNARQGRGRRSLAVGRLRPDIVLYGEEHPHASLIAPLVTHDLALKPDVLLILGTSLRVHGLKIMIREFAKAVHSKGGTVIFVNETKPADSVWGDVIDYHVEWDCDAWVLDLKSRREDIWLPQGQTVEKKKEPKVQGQKKPTRQQIRSQAQRDNFNNGVYVTYAILDKLRLLKDEEGRIAKRKQIWPRRAPRPARRSAPVTLSSASDNLKLSKSRPVVEIPVPSTAAMKGFREVSKKTSAIGKKTSRKVIVKSRASETTIKKRSASNKRKAVSSMQPPEPALPDPQTTKEIWQHLRAIGPALSERPPSVQNIVANDKNNHFPNLKGIHECPASLTSHPPMGLEPEMMSKGMRRSQRLRGDKGVENDTIVVVRKDRMKITAILESPGKGKRKRV